ncbi:PAAR-like protein [Chryseobacterium sp. WLY505]|uniref:PAAR-like protein n=1 Tax=Chryseobacterium sp. WLY505 TaxID=3068892 RepID=UPI002796B006|nr:PAAR-like protein [Chryseobacterium sp. WLY505]MDQ1858638.1 PAAR-like protein [Chryseobacterium sp. WLY505]
MSQLYIAQDTPLTCSKGRRLIGIGVSSQSSVKLKKGAKLMATEKDRFKDNFICPEMMMAGALAGVAVAAAFSGGLFVLAAAAWAGSALIDDCLNICSFLCKGSDWQNTHPKVKIENKKPLLQNSSLHCFIGGKITFHLPVAQLQEASIASRMAQDSYEDNNGENTSIDGYTRINTDDQAELDKLFGPGVLASKDFNTNKDNGFFSSLYYNKETGDYFVAFRGSEPKGMQFYHDWFIEDGGQALGFATPQIEKTRMLAEKMDNATGGKVKFTGHSLGGGNSAMASYYTGLPGYTFNARGVHGNTLDYLDKKGAVKSTSGIINYSTSNDILNGLQNNREGLLSTLAFSRIPGLNKIAIFGGLTGGVPRALGEQNEIFGYIEDNEGLGIKTIGSGHSAYNDAFQAMLATINTDVVANNI